MQVNLFASSFANKNAEEQHEIGAQNAKESGCSYASNANEELKGDKKDEDVEFQDDEDNDLANSNNESKNSEIN